MIWTAFFAVEAETAEVGAAGALGGALAVFSFSVSASSSFVGCPRRKCGRSESSSGGGALGAATGGLGAGAVGAGEGGFVSGSLLSAPGGGSDPGRLNTGGPSSSSRGLDSALCAADFSGSAPAACHLPSASQRLLLRRTPVTVNSPSDSPVRSASYTVPESSAMGTGSAL